MRAARNPPNRLMNAGFRGFFRGQAWIPWERGRPPAEALAGGALILAISLYGLT